MTLADNIWSMATAKSRNECVHYESKTEIIGDNLLLYSQSKDNESIILPSIAVRLSLKESFFCPPKKSKSRNSVDIAIH